MTVLVAGMILICLVLAALWIGTLRCSQQRGLRLAMMAVELRRLEQAERSQQHALREFKVTISEQADQIDELEQSLSHWRERHAAEVRQRQALSGGRITQEQED